MKSQASSFLSGYNLPVLSYLSAGTLQALEKFLQNGNRALRERKLLEFFKSVDWLDESDLASDRLWLKMEPALKKALQKEIHAYLEAKTHTRQESAEKREQYRLRVFAYFRSQVSSADKALLESLRDFELDLTGRDVNWRHYFSLDSFKKIDGFVEASSEERQTLFSQFKKDVETYKKNYDKIYQQGLWQEPEPHFTFDDWCDWFSDQETSSNRKQQQAKPANSNQAIFTAYQLLELPLNAPQDAVKKQFRRLTLQYHPDVPTGSEEKMKQLVGAYQTLQSYWGTLSAV